MLYNETPYEDDHFHYFLGRSYTTTYTHLDVAEFRNQMFYKVVAYKNYRGDVDNVLADCFAAGHQNQPGGAENRNSQLQYGGDK